MRDDAALPTRAEIVIDAHDANPELLLIWLAARAVKLVEELRRSGIESEVVSLEIDGVRRYHG